MIFWFIFTAFVNGIYAKPWLFIRCIYFLKVDLSIERLISFLRLLDWVYLCTVLVEVLSGLFLLKWGAAKIQSLTFASTPENHFSLWRRKSETMQNVYEIYDLQSQLSSLNMRFWVTSLSFGELFWKHSPLWLNML